MAAPSLWVAFAGHAFYAEHGALLAAAVDAASNVPEWGNPVDVQLQGDPVDDAQVVAIAVFLGCKAPQ